MKLINVINEFNNMVNESQKNYNKWKSKLLFVKSDTSYVMKFVLIISCITLFF